MYKIYYAALDQKANVTLFSFYPGPESFKVLDDKVVVTFTKETARGSQSKTIAIKGKFTKFSAISYFVETFFSKGYYIVDSWTEGL